ncbi:hypothetical protein PTTG_05428 [Puccinia triticina 1-1 BBBD Race 1]|uniref:GH26 domain-containing protein n=1 Tax=Puccinia triticina (isolate 1-1 / race 1 (BBBD)) TaxID=630390 RepID=A0A180GSJ8_PUCT1|nr:hypothetical protein PTTG_05428 [Puccinia triticina 1-1 BBBD Race 1]
MDPARARPRGWRTRATRMVLGLMVLTTGLADAQDPPAPAPPAPGPIPRALNEHDGVYFGVWPDTAHGFSDTPAMINQRLGFNTSVFQIAQLIPLPPYNYTTGAGGPAPEYLIEQTQTDAAVFLTVYPTGLDTVTDDDLKLLGDPVTGIHAGDEPDGVPAVCAGDAGHLEPVRLPADQVPGPLAPHVARRQDRRPRHRRRLGPLTPPQSYPYGQSSAALSPEDLALLDTDHDGKVGPTDDPFTPYYPGDDQVDWIGLSTYYKGPNFQNVNVPQPSGYCGSVMNGTSPTSTFNWYDMYCNRPGKACMIAESGAAFHVDAVNAQASTAKSIVDLQRAWWQDCITSPAIVQSFPRLKLHMHFEHVKLEMDGGKPDLRDYRLSNDTDTLAAFKQDFSAVSANFIVPAFRPLPPGVPALGRPLGSPNSPVPSVPGQPGAPGQPQGIVFQTQRNPVVTGPPTLFGHPRSPANRVLVQPRSLLASSALVLALVSSLF